MNVNKEFRYKRQECYNINAHELIKNFHFENENKIVYGNINFTIFIDDYCNANCKFCVAQLRFENRSQMYKKDKIENDEEYFSRLTEVLKIVRQLNPSLSITGGEPTCSRRLIKTLQIVNSFNFRKKVITTNGSGLLNVVDGKTVLDHLIENGWNHINISIAHYDEDINEEIMDYGCEGKAPSKEDLKYIVKHSIKNGLRPRISCLLLKSGIKDVNEVKKYLDYCIELGVDNVIFRELMDFDLDKMINNEKKNYCFENKVRLNDIWEQIDKDKEFNLYKNILGYYYYVEIYKYRGIDVVSESADLKQLYKEKENHKNYVYEMIFHPNGNLNGSWVDNEEILDNYKK